MKAKFLQLLDHSRGVAAVYRMTPPLDGHTYVVASAVVAPYSGPECYLFASDEFGEITNWGELDGSQRGTLDHGVVFESIGYEITQ